MEEAVERLIRRPVESHGGTIEKIDIWGRRKLSYPIRKQVEGSYVLAHLQLEPDLLKEIEQSYNISEDVLRHLVIRREEVEAPAT